MKCIHCQKQHPDFENYCSVTGKLIDPSQHEKYTYETLEFCVSCGEPNKESSLHCSNCGTETIKVSSKKKSVDKLIDQGLTAIPDLKNNVNFTKSKETLKEASVQHTNYIKKTPLILVPIAIPIAIILLFTTIVVSKLKNDMGTIASFLELDGLNILDADVLSAYLYEELGVSISVPDFPLFTMLISLMHNVNYKFSSEFLEGSNSEIFKLQETNLFLGLLIVPIIALTIGAIVYGIMAKKYNWHFWRGIVYSTAIYTVFLIVVTVFARFKVKANTTNVYDDLVKFNIELVPSIINAVITGVVLSAVIFTFVGYVSYSGKQIIEKLEGASKYFKYAMYALATTVVGFVLHLVNAIIAVKSSLNDLGGDFVTRMVIGSIPESTHFIAAIYAAVVNWYLTFFGKLNIITREDGDTSISWFFGGDLDGLIADEVIDTTTFIPPFIFVIVIFALVGGIGFLFTKNQLLDWKEVLIIAGIFTAIQLVMLYFINVKVVTLENSYKSTMIVSISWLQQLITTTIFAFAAIMAGSFVKIKVFFGKNK